MLRYGRQRSPTAFAKKRRHPEEKAKNNSSENGIDRCFYTRYCGADNFGRIAKRAGEIALDTTFE
jgi:hypothetical protein